MCHWHNTWWVDALAAEKSGCLQVFKIQTYDHYGDIQLLNHLTSVLRTESPMSAESLTPDVDDVMQRWNRLLTGIADREVQYNCLSHRVSKKLCQCYFLNNSVKHWSTLIIFSMQHHKESWRKLPQFGSYLRDKEQKISWHSFFETQCTIQLFSLTYTLVTPSHHPPVPSP